jgi:integrase
MSDIEKKKRKPKARGNGEGTIYKRKDNTWCAGLTVGHDSETGKQKRQYFYGKTREEVKQKLNQAINDLSKGEFIEPNKITFGSWLLTWLNEYKKTSIKESTYAYYRYIIDNYITDKLKTSHIKDIRPEHLQAFYNELYKDYSQSTVKRTHIVIHQALTQAVENRIAVRNVSDSAILPKSEKEEMRVLSVKEQKKFLQALEEEKYKLLFKLLLACGLRIGELLGLHWDDVDFKKGIITVRRTISRVKNYDDSIPDKTKIVIDKPKTKKSERSIPVPKILIPELKEYKQEQQKSRKVVNIELKDTDYVFNNGIAEPLEASNLRTRFYNLIKKSKIDKANIHSLRHTYATRLLELGERPEVVKELLGHSSISITLDLYAHVMPETKQAAAQKLEYLFKN